MAKQVIQIGSIMNGMSQLQYFSPVSGLGKAGAALPSFHASIGIDPDMPISDTAKRMSGFIRPTAMAKISGSVIQAAPLWLQTNPLDTNAYCYDNAGNVYAVDSSLNVTLLGTLSNSYGNGMEYYDSNMLFATNTDIASYGTLGSTPTFNNNYWTTTLGKTALTGTTYPSINGVAIPNHPLFRHPSAGTNGICYIGDVASGRGAIHQIWTTNGSNTASTFNALQLDYNHFPTAIDAYQDTLAVAAIEGISTTTKQKPAILYFWDLTSLTPNEIIQVEFPDPFITAIKNVNGILYVWSGNATGGCRLSTFSGGFSFEEQWYQEDGFPPFQGAVDSELNRVVWGTQVAYPESAVSVMAKGSRAAQAGGGIQNILKTTSSGTNGNATCLKYIQNTALNIRQPVVGWKDDSGQGLDKSSTTYGLSVFRSEVFKIGAPYSIKKIRIPLAQPLSANHNATFKIYKDEATSSDTVATITSGALTGENASINNNQNIVILPTSNGQHNFFLEFRTTGTDLLTLSLPITIEVETLQD